MSQDNLVVSQTSLFQPELEELSTAFKNALATNFSHVKVSVEDCPNLTDKPFCLSAVGLCGSPKIADVGGVPNLLDPAYHDRKFSLDQIGKVVGSEGLIIGAGAGSATVVGMNSEWVPNYSLSHCCNKTYYAIVDKEGNPVQALYPSKEFGLMGNLFMSDGLPGKVIAVEAKGRIGKENFISCLRRGILEHFPDQNIGVGGVFCVTKGSVNAHVMPDFFKEPKTEAEVHDWLKFYSMHGPLTCLSVFVSGDMGLNLRLEHTHFFSHLNNNQAGHYHNDTTPENVEYVAYFLPAQSLFRINDPLKL